MTITEKMQQKQSVRVLLNILRITDEQTYMHSVSVSYIAEELLMRVCDTSWSEEEKEAIITGALLHDIGKAFVPFQLQSSSQALDFNRKVIMQAHCNIGYEVVRDCGFHEITEEIVLLHHERSDGSGYPILEDFPTFCEENIPDYVTLISYADIFDALTAEKPYRCAMTAQEALEQICKEIDGGKLSYRFKKVLIDFVKENVIT